MGSSAGGSAVHFSAGKHTKPVFRDDAGRGSERGQRSEVRGGTTARRGGDGNSTTNCTNSMWISDRRKHVERAMRWAAGASRSALFSLLPSVPISRSCWRQSAAAVADAHSDNVRLCIMLPVTLCIFAAENPPSQFSGMMRRGGVEGAGGRRPEVREEPRQGEGATRRGGDKARGRQGEGVAGQLLRETETCLSFGKPSRSRACISNHRWIGPSRQVV